jgi:hypothetical protein
MNAVKPPPGKNGFTYREQYGVIILCKDAKAQEALYNKLKAQGYRLKVVTV